MITLDQKQLEEVKTYLGEVPLKYSLPLVQFLEKLMQEQNSESEKDSKTKEK